MAVTPSQIFSLATALHLREVEAKDAESYLRSAASRAYYAAYHAANDAVPEQLQPNEADRRGKESHVSVQVALEIWAKGAYQGRSEARAMARDLPKLKHIRKHADYLLLSEFRRSDADVALTTARAIINSAENAKRISGETG
jgi:uncharacterized protein (UPF0332 family)